VKVNEVRDGARAHDLHKDTTKKALIDWERAHLSFSIGFKSPYACSAEPALLPIGH
jgi:hypothetical protein